MKPEKKTPPPQPKKEKLSRYTQASRASQIRGCENVFRFVLCALFIFDKWCRHQSRRGGKGGVRRTVNKIVRTFGRGDHTTTSTKKFFLWLRIYFAFFYPLFFASFKKKMLHFQSVHFDEKSGIMFSCAPTLLCENCKLHTTRSAAEPKNTVCLENLPSPFFPPPPY